MRTLTLFLLLAMTASAGAIDPKDLKPGLLADYSSSDQIRTNEIRRLDAVPAVSEFDGTIQWNGTLYIVTPGEYTFIANAQDVEIDSAMQFEQKLYLPLRSVVGDAQLISGKKQVLEAGIYKIIFSLKSKKSPRNSSRFELLWEGPGFGREPIPYFFFGHTKEDRDAVKLEEVKKREYGHYLIEDRNCMACHRAAESVPKQTGPDLFDIGRRVYPGWLDAWLADPAKVRPHTNMPKLFGDDEKGKAERYAVVAYLAGLGGPYTARDGKDDAAAAKRGERLFTLTGCAACHANTPNEPTRKRTDDDDPLPPYDPIGSILGHGAPTGPQSTYAFGAVGSKTGVGPLAEYLRDPRKTNPHGRMPAMNLTNAEARELALYLTRQKDAAIKTAMPAEPKAKPGDLAAAKTIEGFANFDAPKQWREVGKVLMTQKGCVNCHTVKDNATALKPREFPSLEAVSAKASAGCVSAKPDSAKHAAYSFTDQERAALALAIGERAATKTVMSLPGADTRFTLKRLMCLNCHTRDGEGGIAATLADKMKAFESAENADDVRPPSLTAIGHKATSAWLKDVLLNGGKARPWMGLRMPQYGEAHVGHLVAGLTKLEGIEPDKLSDAKTKFDAGLVAAGRTLTGKDGYGCIACHDIAGVASGGTRGPDLALTQQRVRPEWFERWMHNPHRLSPGTKMPQYFLDGKATNTLLGADPAKQIEAFKAYFSLGSGLPLPNGLEPPKGVVLAVKDRPQLLRTFMPEGAGTRSFAVGYPGQVNVAYDGTQARLAYAWAGNFLDASPVWTNRGGNPAKLLGPKFFTAPAGHPWAVGNDVPDFAKRASDPAYGANPPEGKAFNGTPLLSFNGYSIDEKGYPTFTSTVREADGATLKVSESHAPLVGSVATGIARQFTVDRTGTGNAWFLAGTSATPPRHLIPKGAAMTAEKAFTVPATGWLVLPQPNERAITLTVPTDPAGANWHVIPSANGWRAVLAFAPGTGPSRIVVNTWAVPKDDDALIRELR
jgi:cbb3-type cytochrome oxidase cytochrome c subunit